MTKIINQIGDEPQLTVNPLEAITLEADGCPAKCGQCLDNPEWIAYPECSSVVMNFRWEIECRYCDEGKKREVGKVWQLSTDNKTVTIPAYTLVVCQQYDVTLTAVDDDCLKFETCPEKTITLIASSGLVQAIFDGGDKKIGVAKGV